MKSVYYAHPMSTYGTRIEAEDLALLGARFASVINPATPAFQQAVKRQKACGLPTMAPFLDAIRAASAVAYRPFPDGKIGAGIASEVLEAILGGKLILRLPECLPIGFSTEDILSIPQTRDANKAFSRMINEDD